MPTERAQYPNEPFEQVGASSMWGASALAKEMAQYPDETIEQAILLLVSLKQNLQPSLLALLQEPPGQRYSGTIKNFWPERHFGFIKCDELEAQFGGDTFLSDQEICHFAVGAHVTFSIMLNKEGKPQAKLLQDASLDGSWAEESPQLAQEEPFQQAQEPPKKARRKQPPAAPPPAAEFSLPVPPPPPPPLLQQQQQQQQAQQQQWGQTHWEAPPAPPKKKGNMSFPSGVASAAHQDGSERFRGTISKFFPDKCFGFITSDDLKQRFGSDVFLSDQEIGQFTIGSVVTFNIQLNKDGRPQARGLADGNETVSSHTEEDGRYQGVIKNFFPERHYGFITCPALEATYGDVFLSDQEIGYFGVGDSVSFHVAFNAQGRPQARALAPMGGM